MSLRSELKESRRRQEDLRNKRGRNVPWRKRLRIVRRKVGSVALALSAPTIVRVLARSWKVERIGREHFDATIGQGAGLAALWHGRMLPGLPLHSADAKKGNIDVLVSPSDDGSLVTGLLRKNGYGILRGSTNRQSARSLREMVAQLGKDRSVVITPDGPRGPRHDVNIGLAWLARETGLPILTMGVATDNPWYLKSWDRFTIPKRGARVVAVYNEPLRIDKDASEEDMEELTRTVRAQLIASERQAFEHLGCPVDWEPEDEA